MDLLITVLGNALVQDEFRETLLSGNPVAAAEAWGFRLTKGEREMLELIFKDGDDTYKKELLDLFERLEDKVYENIQRVYMCERPCKMSVPKPVHLGPPPETKAA